MYKSGSSSVSLTGTLTTLVVSPMCHPADSMNRVRFLERKNGGTFGTGALVTGTTAKAHFPNLAGGATLASVSGACGALGICPW